MVTSDWVSAPVEITATPLPTATATPTPRRPRITPTPSLADCLHYTASAGQSTAAWGQILVDIEVDNRCGRDLAPLDVWFEVRGWHDGAVVQTVRGHPFDTLYRGGHGSITIGLPGSLDWYDRIQVVPAS